MYYQFYFYSIDFNIVLIIRYHSNPNLPHENVLILKIILRMRLALKSLQYHLIQLNLHTLSSYLIISKNEVKYEQLHLQALLRWQWQQKIG